MRTGRDVGEYVHRDFTYQAALGALPDAPAHERSARRRHPVALLDHQSGFVTYARPTSSTCRGGREPRAQGRVVPEVGIHGARGPTEGGGTDALHLAGTGESGFHADALKLDACEGHPRSRGTYLLPQAYPEARRRIPPIRHGHAVFVGPA